MRRHALPLALALLANSTTTVAAPAPRLEPRPKARGEDVAENVNAPRRDARRVSFTVTEGTWMNLDVSPDGRTLVFDLLGDLYSLPLEGGVARPLTRGPAWDFHPRFSPDGTRIAFSSDREGMTNAWVMDADGTRARAVTTGNEFYVRSPEWSPDGDYLIARRETAVRGGIPPVELWMWHVEGGDGIQVTRKEKLNDAAGPAFSKDGRFLWFSAREGHFSYEPDMRGGLWQVKRLDRRTGEVLQVTQGFGGAARPVPSPDGRTLLFVSRRDADTVLVERDLATGAERVLARGLSRDEQEGFAENDIHPAYAFTPDGLSVVLWSRGRLARIDVASGTASAIPFRADVVQFIAPRVVVPERVPDGPVRARILRWAGESPEGRLITFDAFGKIWLQALKDGRPDGSPWRLTRDGDGPAREHAPSISPDGRWLAFVTWSDRDGGHVWRARLPEERGVAAPPPLRLTTVAGHYANPSWSPRGDRIAIVRGSGLEFRGRQPEEESWFEAAWIPSEGGAPEYVASLKLADSLRFHPQVFFSSDGERLFFREPVEAEEPEGDETARLVSVRLDGTDKRAHLGLPVLGEVVPSPDGRWVAFTSRDNAYLAPLPPIALEKMPSVSLEEGAVPAWRLSENAASFVRFTRDGTALTWTHGSRFHRLALSELFAFVARERAAAKDESAKEDDESFAVPPSESFDIAVSLPRQPPEGSLLLRGGRVVTMRGDEVLANADVLVTGSRIAALGPTGTLEVPDGTRVVEVAGKTLIPGIIDTHAHLHYSAFEVFPDQKWEHAANLAYGVTTVYDPSAPSLDTFALAEMIEAGLMTGPRVTSSGDVLYGGKQADVWAPVDSLEAALRQVRRMKAYGARMIKVYQQGGRAQRLWFAEACRKEGMLLTAEGAGELMTDLTLALDGYTAFEHSLPVEIHDDVVQLVARSGIHYTPTLLVSYGGPNAESWFWQHESPHDDPKLNRFTPHRALDSFGRRRAWIHPDEYHFPAASRGIADVLRAGGNVSLGAHGQLQGLGVLWEMRAMAGEGAPDADRPRHLSPHEVLRTSTILAADKIGLAQDLGSIEPGKKADLVVLDDDPLADLRGLVSARWVMKDGRLWDAATLRQEWPEIHDLPPFFWSGRDR